MSMRPEVYGFELTTCKQLFGSGDKTAFKKINDLYQQKMSEVFSGEPEKLMQFKQEGEIVIHRAIMEGVPFAELDCENDIHVFAADIIVHSTVIKSPGDTTDWHMQALWDLRSALAGRIKPDLLKLLAVFEEGRPFFGKKINSSWSYYGYFTAKEVRKLFIVLDELEDTKSFGDLQEILFALTDWLDGISSQNMDMYFYVS